MKLVFEIPIPEERSYQHVEEGSSRHQLANKDIPDGQPILGYIDVVSGLQRHIQFASFKNLGDIHFEKLRIIESASDDDGDTIALVPESATVGDGLKNGHARIPHLKLRGRDFASDVDHGLRTAGNINSVAFKNLDIVVRIPLVCSYPCRTAKLQAHS